METTRRKAARKVGRGALDKLRGAVFRGEIHAPRVASLSDGVDGVCMRRASAFAPWATAWLSPMGWLRAR